MITALQHSRRRALGVTSIASALFLLFLLVLVMWNANGVKAAMPSSASTGAAADASKPQANRPACDLAWGVVSSPSVGTDSNILSGVIAIAPDDVWAVGYYYVTGGVQTLTEHRDGSQWSVVSSPNVGTDASLLNSVTAISSNNVWAVGYYYDSGSGSNRTLTEHWNGSQWSVVSSPNVGTNENRLNGVISISPSDIWAAGYYYDSGSGSNRTLTEHWNGSQWSVISSPNVGANDNVLNAITAASSNDVWAVGETGSSGPSTLIEHWNGSQWSVVSSPNSGTGNLLFGVTAIASDDIWAVGYYIVGPGDYRTLTEHWNGSAWSAVSSPNPDTFDISLNAITATGSNDVWAVGRYYNTVDNGYQTLTEHWNGTAWSVVPSPNVGTGYAFLYGVVAVASDNVWAVGSYIGTSTDQTLIEHYSTLCLTSTPTPTYTLTPIPTNTITLSPTATPTVCTLEWRVIDSPNIGGVSDSNFLYGVAAISSNDVWAVGYSANGTVGYPHLTLIEHWDGVTWSVVASPNADTSVNELYGVTAVASNDVWAVGYYQNAGGLNQTLTEHWNGSQWSVVSSPNVSTYDNYLKGVTAISSNDVWAVGYYNNSTGDNQTLTEHWDGSQWSVVSSPNAGISSNVLNGVTAISSTDVWAVGYYNVASNRYGTLTEHWDGSQWSVISSSSPGTDSNYLNGVTAIAPDDIWAVGRYNDINYTYQALIEHWDGSQWSAVNSPSPDTFDELYATTAISSDDVWAVGYGSGNGSQTLIEHWDGSQWSVVASPSPGTFLNYLNGVAAISSTDIWTVGDYVNANGKRTLTERYFNPCNTATATVTSTPTYTPVSTQSTNTPTSMPSETPTVIYTATDIPTSTRTLTPLPTNTNTPLPTQTSGGATATNTPFITNTPLITSTPTETVTGTPPSITPTPTACTISFEDVPPDSTFYPFIQCLACRGIINGYPCGGPGEPCNSNNDPYFRPGNKVTRGQFAKIAANSAGFNDTPGAQQYEDVPPGSTFYAFTWRLSSRGYINGYPCGGAGEPCGPSNLPYFRPNANVTRGQLSKIDANAADFQEIPGAQQFEDVAPGSTFYDYIWRLSDRTIINGYPCGGAGEPCGPSNLPYFRPAANATRGQASKTVSNTFFPNCTDLRPGATSH